MIAYLILLALGASNLFAMDNFLKQVKDSAQNTANTLQTLNENLTEDVARYRAAKNAAIESAKAAAGWLAWAKGLFSARVIKAIKLPEGNEEALKAVLQNHSVLFDQNWANSNALEGTIVNYSDKSVQDFIDRKIEAERTNQEEPITQLRTNLAHLKQENEKIDGELKFKQADLNQKLQSIQMAESLLAYEKKIFHNIDSTSQQEDFYNKQLNIINLKTDTDELSGSVKNLESDINHLKYEIQSQEERLNNLLKNQKSLPIDPLFLYDHNKQKFISLSELLHSKIRKIETLCVNQYLVDQYSNLVRYGVFYNKTSLEEIYKALCEMYPGIVTQINNNFGPMHKIAVALAEIFSHKKFCVVPFQIKKNCKFEEIALFEIELVEQVAQTIITNNQNQNIVATKISIEQHVQDFCLKVFNAQEDEFWNEE